MPGKRAAPDVRFWRHVRKTDGCWLWTGAISPHNGYGRFGVKVAGKHITVSAHRFSWELHTGQLQTGEKVLHDCDVPACVNPDHLFLGTQADNMLDMIYKGRKARGSRAGNAKLTEQEVMTMRRLHALENVPNSELAKRFGCSYWTVLDIVQFKTWTHV